MTSEQEARAALTAWASLLDRATLTGMPRVTNPLWRVESQGPPLVLKQLPQYPPGVSPAVEFRVLTHLQRQAVPVALPVVTDDQTLHTTVNGRRWVLLPYLPHEDSDYELGPGAAATAHAVGAAIGHLDRALVAYPWPVDSFVDDPQEVIAETLPRLPPEAVRLVQPLVDVLGDACAGLPVQLTHGDCNTGNVLVQHGRVSGFIDIDHLPTGPRVRDLAYYLASRLDAHLGRPGGQDAASALAAVLGDFVVGYRRGHELSDREVRALVPLMLLVEVGGAHWALHGWEPNPTAYQRSVRSIAWIVDHFDQLSRAARQQ